MEKMNLSKLIRAKENRGYITLLIVNVFYLAIFTAVYISSNNYEFLMYVGVVLFFVLFIGWLHLKYRFSSGVLICMTIWGFLHMAGGGISVKGNILYALQLIPVFLRYDQLVHAFGFGTATTLSYYCLKPNLSVNANFRAVAVLLVFIGMGLGAVNEIVEFLAVLLFPDTNVGGYDNTMWDIVFNTFGAIIAVTWITIKRNKSQLTAEAV
jgi:putative membrane protein